MAITSAQAAQMAAILGGGLNSYFNTSAGASAGEYGGQDVYKLLENFYGPYTEAGLGAQEQLINQYMMLLNNPGMVNQNLASGFETSPGYEFQMEQAMNASNMAAASGGMSATPSHQQQSQTMAQNLASQDYWNYMNNMMELYGMGMKTASNINQTGYNANQQMATGLGNYGKQQTILAGMEQMQKNNALNSMLGGLLSIF
jgi:hypothetical protein